MRNKPHYEMNHKIYMYIYSWIAYIYFILYNSKEKEQF